jgi:hypothetical protein
MAIDITGQRFGRLVAIERQGRAKNGNALWLCQCSCGNMTVVESYGLRHGSTKSCGCLRSEMSSKAIKTNKKTAINIGNEKNLRTASGVPVSSVALSSRNQSGVTGVTYLCNTDNWQARMMVNGRYVLLKSLDTFQEAVEARKAAEKKYFGSKITVKTEFQHGCKNPFNNI